MKILILYTELAGYTITCLKQVKKDYPQVDLHVFRWPVNNEAPFDFDFDGINIYNKNEFDLVKLESKVNEIGPDCLIVSGWIDKEYTTIAKKYKKKIPVTLTLDNHWRGDLKQVLASKLSRFLVRDKFNKAWVPGEVQAKFARKLGFREENIFKGFYAADTTLFTKFGIQAKQTKENSFPKRFLYVGRYVEHKGIFDIWKAFIELQNEQPNEWELWSVGTGDQWDHRMLHDKIKHFGFVQPDQFQEIINETSIYLLPSHFEPWGVSLHEFAAAGYPAIVSDQVGSSEAFCLENKNGHVFEGGNVQEIKDSMKKMMNLTQERFNEMADISRTLSLQITPEKWAKTLMKIANGTN
ncbi:MAG: glycosyltransferase [Flavobacteriales bacterium]|nr:glycosyltransferase [Flavobacteriales bacterium]